jgi:hypothetical protein
MALRTIGTNATTSLSAFVVGFNDTIAADLATLNIGIKRDPPGWNAFTIPATTGLISVGGATGIGSVRATINQAYIKKGTLVIPNRGQLILKDGDFVCFDATTGWPIVISGDAAQNGPYTHT